MKTTIPTAFAVALTWLVWGGASVSASEKAAPPALGKLPGLRKLADFPLRDTAICRGPDGTWYLTGTVPPFWAFNEGIKLWKSKDLAAWEPLGFVWKYGGSPWHKPYLDKKKPLWAPEVHFLRGTFWLTYSLPGWDGTGKTSGCGLLRSTSGKPEGPYQDVQPAERLGDEIDASLFQDDDVMVLNKPAGLAVQGGSGTTRHIDGMLGVIRTKDGQRPRLVHRLDKDTGGLTMVARSERAFERLTAALAARTVGRFEARGYALLGAVQSGGDGTRGHAG